MSRVSIRFGFALECHPAAGLRPFIIPCMECVACARGVYCIGHGNVTHAISDYTLPDEKRPQEEQEAGGGFAA